MAGIDDAYAREMHRQIDRFAAVPPDSHYDLGDFGVMDGKVFQKLGNLRDLAIPVRPRLMNRSDRFTYQSRGSVELRVLAGAQVGGGRLGQSAAQVEIAFDAARAILFQAADVEIIGIDNLKEVGDRLVALYKRPGKAWRLNHVVITEIRQAGRLAVFVSHSRNASVTLSGTLALSGREASAAEIDLTRLSIVAGRDQVFVVQDQGDATPLFQLHEVKDPITRAPFFDEYR